MVCWCIELEDYGRVLNTASCDGETGLNALLENDWHLLSAWLGALLVATCATALLGTAIPSKNEVQLMQMRCLVFLPLNLCTSIGVALICNSNKSYHFSLSHPHWCFLCVWS